MTQTTVKRTYWDDELDTMVYELENGRKICLDMTTEEPAEVMGSNTEVVTQVRYAPADGV